MADRLRLRSATRRTKRIAAPVACALLVAVTVTGAGEGASSNANSTPTHGKPALDDWPAVPQTWLRAWGVWRFRNRLEGQRPHDAPATITRNAWEFLRWTAWHRNGARVARPQVTRRIPRWAWQYLADLDEAVPPVPPGAPLCVVERATMTAPGCSVMRNDPASQANPTRGLWGQLACASSSRYAYEATGGDTGPEADGSDQGNTAYREITVHDGDSWEGESAERCELGRNTTSPYYKETKPGSDDGTFALTDEGEHRITFFSERYHDDFAMKPDAWQVIFQNKQEQPYDANGPVDGAPALEIDIYDGKIVLRDFWTEKWTTPAPPKNTWIRYALDAFYSKDASKGWVVLYVDRNGDGDFLDSGETSPLLYMPTLAYITERGSSPREVGDPLPSHMRIGIYHSEEFGTSTLDFDNVQVVG